jgi:carboxylesterase
MSEPFLLQGGDHGCLLVHGFTGGPGEMRGLGEHLAGRGHTVFGVRLAGHGGSPDELAAVHWRDWLADAAAGLAYLRGRCARVSLVGFSLGGALSILLAAQEPLDHLVLLATPLRLQGDWRVNLLALMRHTVPWFYPFERADFSAPAVRAQVLARQPDADLDDPAVQAYLRRQVRISTGAIDELRLTLAAARAALPRVRAPALVMHGRDDDTAPLDSAETIVARIGSSRKELLWWEQTGHQMLVEGPHRQAIYGRVGAFLAE